MSENTTTVTDVAVSSFTFGTHAADVQEISVAAVFGVCSGFATKKIAKGAGLAVGLGFMSLQALTYTGVVKVDWEQIETQVAKGLDADGDGKITQNDFKLMGLRLIHNLGRDLPSAGGFAGGFFLGFSRG
ncbi:FUN14 family-domain-containing protein [Chytriomyces sp. MP71]|nr:FUN14 family-domain-containing protein [Chytriomyces sp. MP71]